MSSEEPKNALSVRDTQSAENTVERIKTVNEFLADALDGFQESDLLRAVEAASPWFAAGIHGLKEAVPTVKFAVKFFEKLTEEPDPNRLGQIACTLAYQRSVEQALAHDAVGATAAKRSPKVEDLVRKLRASDVPANVRFTDFRYRGALLHPFVIYSDETLLAFANASRINATEFIVDVHSRFVVNLKQLLSHGDTRLKFEPFRLYIETDASAEERAYAGLLDHIEFQRWLYEDRPLLSVEPFSLSDVYIETDCGVLTWKALQADRSDTPEGPRKKRVDPFSETDTERTNLLDAVLSRIADPVFREAIVIQGVAGAGKSAFTLHLFRDLIRRGLRPIRVLLRDLPSFGQDPIEAFSQAVRFPDDEYWVSVDPAKVDRISYDPGDFLLSGDIFKEQVPFTYVSRTTDKPINICPYVLILDGWDEVTVSASEGFQQRLDQMLTHVRSLFLRPNGPLVRVILTGRPSDVVYDTHFMRDTTPVLTIRPLTPGQFAGFANRLRAAQAAKRIPVTQSDPWTMPDRKKLNGVLTAYRNGFEKQSTGALEVMGLPLLAYLSFRVISRWEGDAQELVSSQTTLQRSLLDLVCPGSANTAEPLDPNNRFRFTGADLRALLRDTAAAMTVYGSESIPYYELELRLQKISDVYNRIVEELNRRAAGAAKDHPLSRLVIAFYFKGGRRDQGCEFLHRSFREYLFAEKIVEALKEYGRRVAIAPQEKPDDRYWQDFDVNDARYDLSRNLGNLLAPQWITAEVAKHLDAHLRWEIGRPGSGWARHPLAETEPLPLQRWEIIRDGLADLWDWWAEGAHLRPQPGEMDRGQPLLSEPFVFKLIRWSMPQYNELGSRAMSAPPRTTTMDSHLGDALYTLAATVHHAVMVAQGWQPGLWANMNPADFEAVTAMEGWQSGGDRPVANESHVNADLQRATRRCQSLRGAWISFRPESSDYFKNYCDRINSAGWRPRGLFPWY